jgi:hypothetical protein
MKKVKRHYLRALWSKKRRRVPWINEYLSLLDGVRSLRDRDEFVNVFGTKPQTGTKSRAEEKIRETTASFSHACTCLQRWHVPT